MEPFTQHTGKLALLDWTDVNTDLIIPARFLKRIERTGYGPALFSDKRYQAGQAPPVEDPDKGGVPDPAFPLNAPQYEGASILVVGPNFGCGSSREHAVWAVMQGGYRALIAPGKDEGFADIFEGNAYNNGLLPIELPRDAWGRIAEAARLDPPSRATIDLEAKEITVEGAAGTFSIPFDMPEGQRQRLLKGLDAIGETLLLGSSIDAHEKAAAAWMMHPGVG
ncbi:MAG: 3-isopropylmalate dehydratase small subunit [Isosphaeraceae bacterium]